MAEGSKCINDSYVDFDLLQSNAIPGSDTSLIFEYMLIDARELPRLKKVSCKPLSCQY
jgi:hypothetical protein